VLGHTPELADEALPRHSQLLPKTAVSPRDTAQTETTAMGDVIEFKRRPKKPTGFLPADLGKVPAKFPDPIAEFNAILFASAAICAAAFVMAITRLWLRR